MVLYLQQYQSEQTNMPQVIRKAALYGQALTPYIMTSIENRHRYDIFYIKPICQQISFIMFLKNKFYERSTIS